MMDDMYSYPYAEHPSYSPPPDSSLPGQTDWSSATPDMAPSAWRPFGAQMLGDTGYHFLQRVIAWFNAVRSS
jgi:hypothetical protein